MKELSKLNGEKLRQSLGKGEREEKCERGKEAAELEHQQMMDRMDQQRHAHLNHLDENLPRPIKLLATLNEEWALQREETAVA